MEREREQHGRLEGEASVNDRNVRQYMEEGRMLVRDNDIEAEKAAALREQLGEMEMRVRSKEGKIDDLRKSLTSMRVTASTIREQAEDLAAEREALERHARVLESQNMELNDELGAFAYSEEVVRSHLSRRDRVEYLKARNEDTLRKSFHDLRMSSPNKRHF